MPKPSTADAPSEWSAMVEYSKTVITLASALLALTVTFAEKLLPTSPTVQQALLLNASWILLVVALLAGVLAVAFGINYLRHGTRDQASVFCANAAFVALLLAGSLFLFLGFSRSKLALDNWTAATALNEATNTASTANPQAKGWKVHSLEWRADTGDYVIAVVPETGSGGYVVRLNPSTKRIIEITSRQ